MARLTVQDAQHAEEPFEVPLKPGLTVLVRRPALETLILLGAIPLPLLEAYDKLSAIAAGVSKDPARLFYALTVQERGDFLELMRRYAVEAVIDPPLTLDPDPSRPDAICVKNPIFDITQLTTLFNARPPGAVAVPRGSAAESFPGAEPNPADAAVLRGEDVRPAPIEVAQDSVEPIDG